MAEGQRTENPRIVSYPWGSLERVPREVVGLLRDVRRAARGAVDTNALSTALAEVVRGEVAIRLSFLEVLAAEGPTFPGVRVAFGDRERGVEISLLVETELAHLMIARALDRPRALANPHVPIEAAIEGAVLAIASKVARRAHGDHAALLPLGRGGLQFAPGERRLVVQATVLVDDEAFAVQATARISGTIRETEPSVAGTLRALGDVPVTLPVIAACSTATLEDLAGLQPGDVWMPGKAAWTVRQRAGGFVGDVMLTAPQSGRGIAGKVGDDGAIVIGEVHPVPFDWEKSMQEPKGREESATIADAVLEAPVVVRVELGSVTMTAREWAMLTPGDVVALGKRVGEPAILRVGGVEVARGELIDIEGELGVRIRARGAKA